MQTKITCGKCGQPITPQNITQQGFHRVGRAGFNRVYYTCPSCKRNGHALLKLAHTAAK